MHSAISQPKVVLIGVKVYFAAFSAQRDNWNPTASREKRIDKRRNILSDKSVNGHSPRADEAAPPEENTTRPKMPHQTHKGQHLDDKKNTLIKIEGGGLAPGEQNWLRIGSISRSNSSAVGDRRNHSIILQFQSRQNTACTLR